MRVVFLIFFLALPSFCFGMDDQEKGGAELSVGDIVTYSEEQELESFKDLEKSPVVGSFALLILGNGKYECVEIHCVMATLKACGICEKAGAAGGKVAFFKDLFPLSFSGEQKS